MNTSAPAPNELSEYTGIAAELYDALRGEDPIPGEYGFYANELARVPGPHLEIGCGTGRILLRLLGAGIAAEGLDSSPDMLRICEQKARPMNLAPTLHLQDMLHMRLSRRYGVIFAPLATMMLLRNEGEVRKALGAWHLHLRAGGCMLFSIYVPPERIGASAMQLVGTVKHQGRPLRVWHAHEQDPTANAIVERFRFEDQHGAILGTHRIRLLFWSPDAMRALLGSLGYRNIEVMSDHTDAGPSAGTRMLVFRAARGGCGLPDSAVEA